MPGQIHCARCTRPIEGPPNDILINAIDEKVLNYAKLCAHCYARYLALIKDFLTPTTVVLSERQPACPRCGGTSPTTRAIECQVCGSLD